jgi:hypothetical protein
MQGKFEEHRPIRPQERTAEMKRKSEVLYLQPVTKHSLLYEK